MAQFKLQQDASSQQHQYMQCIHMRIYNSKERTMVEFSEKSYVLNVRCMMSFFRYSLPISYTHIYIFVYETLETVWWARGKTHFCTNTSLRAKLVWSSLEKLCLAFSSKFLTNTLGVVLHIYKYKNVAAREEEHSRVSQCACQYIILCIYYMYLNVRIYTCTYIYIYREGGIFDGYIHIIYYIHHHTYPHVLFYKLLYVYIHKGSLLYTQKVLYCVMRSMVYTCCTPVVIGWYKLLTGNIALYRHFGGCKRRITNKGFGRHLRSPTRG